MIHKKKGKKNHLVLLTILAIVIYGIYAGELQETFGFTSTLPVSEVDSRLKVYYLDVGQADAILIQNQEENMLIDAGNNADGHLLVEYFKELGIKDFRYVVGTHPHEDHIGGLDDVILAYPIDTLYLPDAMTTTKTFEDVLNAMEKKNLAYSVPKISEVFSLGEAKIQVIYTGTDTDDLNNASIILKLTFGQTSFLFTGDAGEVTEGKILNQDIQADVLKVGHHGSQYSSTGNFLNQVKPTYAVISVGLDNNYGHPNKKTLQELEKRQVKVFRTDEDGTILITSDGHSLDMKQLKTNTNGG